MSEIPVQLHGLGRFIKIEAKGKAPEFSPEGPFFEYDDSELVRWIDSGGNVGLNLGDLVAIDVDSQEFNRLVDEFLPGTFTVRSGGGGSHRYYRSDWSGRTQFSSEESDMGSLRSGNWYTVIPPSIHPTGKPYRVIRDTDIIPVPSVALSELVEASREQFGSANTGGGGGGSVGGSPVPQIPSEYPNQSVDWSTTRRWLSANGMVKSLNRTTSSDWSGLEFKIAKCLAEGGFSENTIFDTLDRLNHNSKWHQRGDSYQTRTVRKAIQSAVDDPYVDYSDTGDMDPQGSESHKTEESGERRTLQGGVLEMVDDNVSNHVTKKNGSLVVRSGIVEVQTNDNNWEYSGVLFGEVEEEEEDLGTVVNWEYNQYNSKDYKDLGSRSPKELRMAAEALEDLADELE